MDGGLRAHGRALFDLSLPVSLFDNTQLGLERAISGAALRQSVLSNNMANAETPGYQRQDVDFHSALSAAMKTGDPSAIESVQFQPQTEPGTMRADGNGVDVDTESAAMAKNGLEYEALVSVAKARIEIVQSAIGVG
jgi:flagellar basal-body rod protein FlgB